MRSIVFIFILFGLCRNELSAQVLVEKADEIGLKHVAFSADYMGGGIAFFDFDRDGFDDLAVSGITNGDKLYRNIGNGRFEDVTEQSGLVHPARQRTVGINAGDINNDGYKEVLIVTDQRQANYLYLNNGDGTFTDISISAGFGSQRYSLASIFLDVNLDGLLDMYIVNYVDEIRPGFEHICYANQLYVNNGDLTFTEMSEEYGVADVGCGVAAVSTDINGDDIPDLYVANDFGQEVLPSAALINNYPDQSFTEVGENNGLGVKLYGMGVAGGDINNDGLLDYYTTSIGTNALLLQESSNHFVDVTDESGTASTYAGDLFSATWGVEMVDIDHDGLKDILLANGYISSAEFLSVNKLDPNKFYKNIDGLHFDDVSSRYGFNSETISRGLALSDYDNDGDMDIAALNLVQSSNTTEGNMLFYENRMSQGNWLKLKLEGTTSNRDAYGAKVKLFVGDSVRIAEVQGGSSCSSLNSDFVHFGLGSVEVVDSVRIIWPGGFSETYEDLETNSNYMIIEKGGVYILGCMDAEADNYNPEANMDFGCFTTVMGCMDKTALNYDSLANEPSECDYEVILTEPETRTAWVYPTVVKNDWTIHLTQELVDASVLVLVTNMQGKTMIKRQLYEAITGFDNSGLANGIYLVSILNSTFEVIHTSKIIVN
ncbi:MAG: FG-GAP-like repeat-containing protein [Cyclobacteriaceae bacterium]